VHLIYVKLRQWEALLYVSIEVKSRLRVSGDIRSQVRGNLIIRCCRQALVYKSQLKSSRLRVLGDLN
jgi:hypothetical protein